MANDKITINDLDTKTSTKNSFDKALNKKINIDQQPVNISNSNFNELASIANNYLKKKKTHRLQTIITEDLYQALQQAKRSLNIKKDSDIIESLLRIVLNLPQI